MEDEKKSVYVCCEDPKNLDTFTSTTNRFALIKRCRVCSRNHYVLAAQPISLNAEMKKS